MKTYASLIVVFAGLGACGSAVGQEHGSRESSGVIKAAPNKPDKPPAGHADGQGNLPVPVPMPMPAGEGNMARQMPTACASADKEARMADNEMSPLLEGRVIGKGRLHFHTAPKAGCRESKRFIIPGDAVVVHRRHDKWLLIDYISRDGVVHSAWVIGARINLTETATKP